MKNTYIEKGNAEMASFSTISCYAALSVCSQKDVINAYSRMIAALVQYKRYETCSIKTLCDDFKQYYGFAVLNQPMETIINNCIELNLFTYNSTTYQFIPNYSVIDSEGFMDVVEEQDNKYKALLKDFGDYLQQNYKLFCSESDLNDKVVAFIERYGIKTSTDRSVLHKVKDDYLFADYLVYCEENDNQGILDYINDYIVGISLSEIFTYNEHPQKYTAKDATVYLDTGILFRLFGIDSVGYSDNYKQYISNMKKMGMVVKVYDHTVNEMIGIVERSKFWIGNPAYDATLCSETTYFFVSHGWTVSEVDNFSRSIRSRIEDEFNITIDKMSYPKVEDIKTTFEADIKDLIIQTYKESGSTVPAEEIDYSIDQDSKSLFYTQHKNGNIVPYHLDDIKNIFITLNRSLARVGYILSKKIVSSKDYFIPLVMTDLKWGTLIWFNSPAIISAINRPRLVSAAYAAFRPSKELTTKLNETLIKLENEGKVTPEECYFMKTSPIAQRMLTKITANNPEKFIDMTPLDILKEIRGSAFLQGSQSRQKEVDNLEKANSEYAVQLACERQKRVISGCQATADATERTLDALRTKKENIQRELERLNKIADEVDVFVKKRMKQVKAILSVMAFILLGVAYIAYKQDAGILSLVSIGASILTWILTLWGREKIVFLSIVPKIEERIRIKRNTLLHFSEKERFALQQEIVELEPALNDAIRQANEARECLRIEQMKMDDFSVDLSILEKQVNI